MIDVEEYTYVSFILLASCPRLCTFVPYHVNFWGEFMWVMMFCDYVMVVNVTVEKNPFIIVMLSDSTPPHPPAVTCI